MENAADRSEVYAKLRVLSGRTVRFKRKLPFGTTTELLCVCVCVFSVLSFSQDLEENFALAESERKW